MKEDNIHDMPLTYCPLCHRPLDAATPVNNKNKKAPEEGDITFCLTCGAILIFTSDLKVRLMREEEVDELPKETIHIIARTLEILKSFIRDRAVERDNNN